jgi:hypothetical protein
MKLSDLRLASKETGPWYHDDLPVPVEFVGNVAASAGETIDDLRQTGRVVALTNTKLVKAVALLGADGLLEIKLSELVLP